MGRWLLSPRHRLAGAGGGEKQQLTSVIPDDARRVSIRISKLFRLSSGFRVRQTKTNTLDAIDPRALEHYLAPFRDPARIHAMCEDYRAGASADYEIDKADFGGFRAFSA
jgi:hypothetical protein